jgi:hypothetical protein
MVCTACHQLVKESVLQGRKLIAMVHAGPYTPSGTARYVTVFSLVCACDERIERRYENLRLPENSNS